MYITMSHYRFWMRRHVPAFAYTIPYFDRYADMHVSIDACVNDHARLQPVSSDDGDAARRLINQIRFLQSRGDDLQTALQMLATRASRPNGRYQQYAKKWSRRIARQRLQAMIDRLEHTKVPYANPI